MGASERLVKRRALTVDELMRTLEEPEAKRMKINAWEGEAAESGESESDDGRVNDDGNETDETDRERDSGMDGIPSQATVYDRFSNSRLMLAPSAASFLPSTFSALGISPALETSLNGMSIRIPTPVQAACIPLLLAGRDCIGNAKTGSGKTMAFALPIMQRLAMDPYGIFALVLTPTRELAFQIAEQFAVLGAGLNVRTAVVVGGMDMLAQATELNNRPHVVIATPGRLADHLRSMQGEWDLSRVKFLVLDEADRLLSSTFAKELTQLLAALPIERQTCLFTATLTPAIEALANQEPRPGKQKPFIHRMSETVETVSALKQHYILIPSHVREVYLFYLLTHPPESTLHLRRSVPEPISSFRNRTSKTKGKKKRKDSKNDEDEIEQPPPTIIFCGRSRTAAYLTLLLKALGIRSTALHSRLTQRERLGSLGLFRASVVPVLVSTDVGARGLDIAEVALVVNWDVPLGAEDYTHRVGRTARAGRGGVAVSLVTERDEERVLRIEDRIKTRLEEMVLPEERVLETLNAVSMAKRLANMELHESDFGKREEIHKIKNIRQSGGETV